MADRRDRRTPTPELTARIVNMVRSGTSPEVAARAAGVPKKTYDNWVIKGEGGQGNAVYMKFAEQIAEARAVAEAVQVAAVSKAANDGSWQAAAWLLERGFAGWQRQSVVVPDRLTQRQRDNAERAAGVDPFEELDNVTRLPTRRPT